MESTQATDIRVAQEIFGYKVFQKETILFETTEKGDRPLSPYSQLMSCAWLVAEKMRISLVAIENSQWFAFTASNDGWPSPDVFLEYLQQGDFELCGAAVSINPAEAICAAALVAREKQKSKIELNSVPPIPENSAIN